MLKSICNRNHVRLALDNKKLLTYLLYSSQDMSNA